MNNISVKHANCTLRKNTTTASILFKLTKIQLQTLLFKQNGRDFKQNRLTVTVGLKQISRLHTSKDYQKVTVIIRTVDIFSRKTDNNSHFTQLLWITVQIEFKARPSFDIDLSNLISLSSRGRNQTFNETQTLRCQFQNKSFLYVAYVIWN